MATGAVASAAAGAAAGATSGGAGQPQPAPEWVYWIGCAGAFEPSAQSISRSTTAILQAAGVDFAVLAGESCTGDPARRLGDEALFQSCRRRNLELLRASGARKVVTHCPHCLNTFRNEYGEDGGPGIEVVHHSSLISELVAQGRVRLRAGAAERVTFHDPCYLGRHNGEYDAPRAVVDAVPGFDRVEMPRSRERSFCCGGGGGQMWLESAGATRVEGLRLEEARSTGATLVATGCPFCKIMLESAATTAGRGDDLRVRDVAEIVHDALAPASASKTS
jgi:Fe-S oxidoreductase